MRRFLALIVIVWAVMLLLPSTSSAQNIAGLVEDETGAVLPGVTVEASSPALIEKTRSVVTDSAGRYTIADLRPGTYAVVFTLTGFKTVRREGITVSGTGITQVNVNLAVGGVEETLTVTGQAPLVDVQTTQQQFIVSKQLFDAIPTPLRDFRSRANLIPGATSFKYGFGQGAGHQMTIHGSVSTDARLLNDGMWVPGLLTGYGEFGGQNFFIEGAQEEVTFDTDGQSAETAGSGVRMNSIPKSGGNKFAGQVVILGAPESFMKRREANAQATIGGLSAGPLGNGDRLKYNYDSAYTFGGPIKQDKIWFFGAYRHLDDVTYIANTYFCSYPGVSNSCQDTKYPAGSQGFLQNLENAAIGRLTVQATPRNKLRLSYVRNRGDSPYNFIANLKPPEATPEEVTLTEDLQVKWQSPVTSRLLLDGGFSRSFYSQTEVPKPYQRGVVSVLEQTTNVTLGSYSGGYQNYYGGHHNQIIGSLSYVTGSHAVKAGVSFENGWYARSAEYYGSIAQLRFNSTNGRPAFSVPSTVAVPNTPVTGITNIDVDLGIYVQDRWTYRRVTTTAGVRFDYFRGSNPAQSIGPGIWVPFERSIPELPNLPNWKDVDPRIGVAYDVFGNGKTAVKVSTGRYLMLAPGQFTAQFNPLSQTTEARVWTDRNNDKNIINPDGSVQFNEIGPPIDPNFGRPAFATRLDPSFSRPFNWEVNAGVEQELRGGLSVNASYHGRWYRNLPILTNAKLNWQTDYYTYTIVGPVDSRLPNGGGEIITRYDVLPSKAGQFDNVVTNAPNNYRTYTGFEFGFTWRAPHGSLLYGGVTPERNHYFNCDPPAAVDRAVQGTVDPNGLRFCETTTPFQSLFKLAGNTTLPFGIEFSGLLQSRPGHRLGALLTINNATLALPTTVKPAGITTLTNPAPPPVELIPFDTRFYDRYTQLDLRLGRQFNLSRLKIRTYADLYNIFNGATVFGGPRAGQTTGANETFGPNWLLTQRSQQAFNVRLGVQFEF